MKARFSIDTALVYLIAGWSGFFVMAVELLGGRLLAPSFGSSIYVWGAIITIFMLALSLGYLLGGRWSTYEPSVRRLGIILMAAAFATVPMLFWAEPLMEWASATIPDPRFGSLVAAAALFFLPTVFCGMVSPYAVRLLVPDRITAGRHAGQLYFVSTFGSAAGTLATSFYLVLHMQVNHILLSLLALSLGLGVCACLRARTEVQS